MAFQIEHVRPPRPLRFLARDPEWDLGQSTRHFKLCVFLWETLRRVVGRESTVGADNFIFFDGADDERKCAPDAFVKLGVADTDFSVWKTWERGAPELCVEILGASDTDELLPLAEKLTRFHSMATREVVAFDADAPEGHRLRAWDRIDGDLVERVVKNERTPCLTVGKWFHVAPIGGLPAALALADDEAGNGMVLTLEEANAALERANRRLEQERERETARADAEKQRADRNEARIAALEEELRRARDDASKR